MVKTSLLPCVCPMISLYLDAPVFDHVNVAEAPSTEPAAGEVMVLGFATGVLVTISVTGTFTGVAPFADTVIVLVYTPSASEAAFTETDVLNGDVPDAGVIE